jgi:predicted alpha/beta-hydrolase family hydrolase
MSGRMFTTALSERPVPEVHGAVLFAFPLHSGAPDRKRGEHLRQVSCPLLFLSGDRDKMAEVTLLTRVVQELPNARLHVIEAADHGFGVLKRRVSPQPVHDELAGHVRDWSDAVLAES